MADAGDGSPNAADSRVTAASRTGNRAGSVATVLVEALQPPFFSRELVLVLPAALARKIASLPSQNGSKFVMLYFVFQYRVYRNSSSACCPQ